MQTKCDDGLQSMVNVVTMYRWANIVDENDKK